VWISVDLRPTLGFVSQSAPMPDLGDEALEIVTARGSE
jgi:hypothetical protein